ncbi:hypothetical protein D3C74_43340 [compost metagenome]
MNKAPSKEVMDYCADKTCGAEILEGQHVVKHGSNLYCNMRCMCNGIGATVILVDDGGR